MCCMCVCTMGGMCCGHVPVHTSHIPTLISRILVHTRNGGSSHPLSEVPLFETKSLFLKFLSHNEPVTQEAIHKVSVNSVIM